MQQSLDEKASEGLPAASRKESTRTREKMVTVGGRGGRIPDLFKK